MRESNKLKKLLKDGKSLLGTWLVLPSSSVCNVISAAGFDFAIIDLEHGPMSFNTAEDMLRALETGGCIPLLRVPANKDWLILRGLEIGSRGIVIPQIQTEKDAQSAITSTKYYPEGERGFSPYTRSAGYTSINSDNLADRKNADILTVLLVEGIEGIKNLDNIIDTSGIDVIYLGTYDLSQSAGYPGQPTHPKVLRFVEKCVQSILKKGISVGCLAETEEQIKQWLKMGIQFIAYCADCSLLFQSSKGAVDHFNNIK